ncbi:hypothetical protein JRG66_12995 [Salinimicrobium tongyeongense]|uniref:Uncharacterized protein n=1 Tax=Salinimicrobium tongyeongense TaxID=2809707 RepID=A0ABY6NPR3_9FLAO|nr:hypothetical protein [Salinimicrobium tongyeongense]UZH54872.1 hypothetical protein JRG66_12995 [Salinimicrobium tongyeongense]
MYKILPIISIFFFSHLSYSQKDIYFLISENDTLIHEQISDNANSYTGYRIFFDKKVRVKKNNTPRPKTRSTEIIEVWEEDPKYDYYVFENPSVHFSFIKELDKLVDKNELKDLNIITDRRDFLKISDSVSFDGLGHTYYFLEERKDGKYLMRRVYPVIFE